MKPPSVDGEANEKDVADFPGLSYSADLAEPYGAQEESLSDRSQIPAPKGIVRWPMFEAVRSIHWP